MRPAFTLGGQGGGIAHTREDYERIVAGGIAASPIGQVLVEESVLGWGEFELEVMRDRNDNVVIVCSIENVDPMGVHTGDSVTVAPQQSLSDHTYQLLRDQAITVIRAVGVETGGSNVQFAVHPQTGEIVVIEMNPRVSRSSALASKATGFPIAKIAARLAVGYALEEIANDITRATPASFEPTIDYVVVKWPRFAFEKFHGVDAGADHAHEVGRRGDGDRAHLRAGVPEGDALTRAGRRPRRRRRRSRSCSSASRGRAPAATTSCSRRCAAARRSRELNARTSIDLWFLRELAAIAADPQAPFAGVRSFKSVDTCAAEFAASTPYYYSAWERPAADGSARHEVTRGDRASVVILGSGPNRIGQGIEFDYCCVHAAMTVRESGRDAVMINCNPETVSTDYDTSDRLYFEPLTLEDVLAVIEVEQPEGVIVQFGGQTPLRLAAGLARAGVRLLGTSVDAIDAAEDRGRFGELLGAARLPGAAVRDGGHRRAGARRRRRGRLPAARAARATCSAAGRWRSSTRAPTWPATSTAARRAPTAARSSSTVSWRTRSRWTSTPCAMETRSAIGGIMQHVEEAGIHSGDSACVLPPHSLGPEMLERIREQTRGIALELGVVGLLNVQYAVVSFATRPGAELYVIEANPRASRTVPFVSKAVGVPLAKLACRLMLGESIADLGLPADLMAGRYVAVKEAVLPFNRFFGADSLLGPEMRSTGEVMGIATDFPTAFAKAQAAAGAALPDRGTVFITVTDTDKAAGAGIAAQLHDLGFRIVATGGTAQAIERMGIPVTTLRKVADGSPHVVDAIAGGDVDLVINTPTGSGARSDGWEIRRAAVARGIPCITTLSGAQAATRAIRAARDGEPAVVSLQEVHAS